MNKFYLTILLGSLSIIFIFFIIWAAKTVLEITMPPHEFAYATPLKSIDELPKQVEQFLSLEALDDSKIKLETYVGIESSKNLQPLIQYLKQSDSREGDIDGLISALSAIDQIPNQKQKAVKLITALIPYKDKIKDESNEDEVIIFITYGLKEPNQLSSSTKDHISSLVHKLDERKQAETFDKGKCPKDYLEGNINIYPLSLENINWHQHVDFGVEKDSPLLEVRFMGLKGIFQYLLHEMERETNMKFRHVDGEEL